MTIWDDGSLWCDEDGDHNVTDLHSLMEDLVNDLEQNGPPYPETIDVIGMDRRVVSQEHVKGYLYHILDDLDEEYGGTEPNVPSTKPTPAMLEAQRVYVAAIVAEYHVWQCEPNGLRHSEPVADWLEEDK